MLGMAIKNDDDLGTQIRELAKSKNALILAHYYQEPEIQDIADFVGDSLELSRKAATTNKDIIVFCGVFFMAEVAKILNPTKKVLIPDINAGCSLALSCPAPLFEEFKNRHPDRIVVTYINCSAAVKALSDIICTSSSAEIVINALPKDQKILFAPDRFLGEYLAKKTNRDIINWHGSCIVHESFSEKELIIARTKYPKAEVIAHPECPGNLLHYANFIGSTSQLVGYVKKKDPAEFIVLTEAGITHAMHKQAPNSVFHILENANAHGCLSCSKCPYMRLNTMEKVYLCLLNSTPEVNVEPNVATRALIALNKMMDITSSPTKE